MLQIGMLVDGGSITGGGGGERGTPPPRPEKMRGATNRTKG